MTSYTRLGNYTVVPVADLENLASAANLKGDTRRGRESMGKKAGTKVLADLGSSTYGIYIAKGDKSSDGWALADGSASKTPVNIVDLTGGAGWTISAGCTYTAGLLTADGVDNPTASQVVALKAGKYRIVAKVAGEGTAGSHKAPKLTVTGATDGALVTVNGTTNLHATAAEDAPVKVEVGGDFTLTVNQNVTLAVSVVNQAAALAAGSAYIAFLPIESIA